MDLFTQDQKGRCCVHLKTETVCIVKKAMWYKGELNYKVLVPQKDEKGKPIFCDATYSEKEIQLLDAWIEQI